MDYALNLTEEQQRHIDEAQTPEEKVRIINEALGIARDGEELSEAELDSVSGGLRYPKSVEKIDEALDMAQLLYRYGGADAANVWLNNQGYPVIADSDMRSGKGFLELRQRWLDKLAGKTWRI